MKPRYLLHPEADASGSPSASSAYFGIATYYVEPLAIGDALADMPLFLTADVYVSVPLDATYLAAWSAVPRRWQVEVEGPSP
ncbi:MAG TPA: hypothetical protein VN699_16100 [Pirellulales bacterium]|nr:hypothetical protein [Pirellulales bacterium]